VKIRYEPWGAWAKLESMPALVALDREGVQALGLHGARAWRDDASPSAPIEVSLAVTSKCAVGCQGCYLDALPDGVEPPRETLLGALDALRDAGVFTVSFGGGEPTTRKDVGLLAEEARRRGLTPVLTTSGIGLSPVKIQRLRAFAQVNVSYDGIGEDYASVRGFEGAPAAESAIAALAAAGVPVGVNVVLTRATFPNLRQTLVRARSLGASEAQLLRYKPKGRAATLDYLDHRLTPEQVASLGMVIRDLALEHAALPGVFHIRIDCAMVSLLSSDPELASAPERLAQYGVFGCEAAGALAAVKVDGTVAPCSFADSTSMPVRGLVDGHQTNPELGLWRAYNAAPAEPCASCSLRPVCKGGCKVVSAFVDGVHGPDPECPRVRAFREEKRRDAETPRSAILPSE
jgi:radical SAM protein with 4Fe4S-binding SPASM domain